MPVTSALGRQRQKDSEFESSRSYIAKLCHKKP
jgi:hypothetical protein